MTRESLFTGRYPEDDGGASDTSFPWKIVNPTTGNAVNEYDSEAEAKDAVFWYEQSYGKKLEVRRG